MIPDFSLRRDNHCVTPLLAAASRGHLDVVRYLLRHGGNDKLFNLDGHTPLHLAEGKGHTSTAHFLRIWRQHYMPLRRFVILSREALRRRHPEVAKERSFSYIHGARGDAEAPPRSAAPPTSTR